MRTEFANNIDASAGYVLRLHTIDVQSTTIHSTKDYDAETGVGTPNGRSFLAGLVSAGNGQH